MSSHSLELPIIDLAEMKPVQARDASIDFLKHVGKPTTAQDATADVVGGFYCDVCDCVMKDSANYLDHINGKKRKRKDSCDHLILLDQRALGTSLRAERATVDQVRERLKAHKKKDKPSFESVGTNRTYYTLLMPHRF